jgi:hypothetical protein
MDKFKEVSPDIPPSSYHFSSFKHPRIGASPPLEKTRNEHCSPPPQEVVVVCL